MSEFFWFKKRNPNTKHHAKGTAILLSGVFAVSGCAEGEWTDAEAVESRNDRSGCSLETADSNIRGNYACVERKGNTRKIKLLTLDDKVFAEVRQDCNGKLDVTTEILGTDGLDHVFKARPFIPESACLDGLQKTDGGKLNRHIPPDALPNESSGVDKDYGRVG